MSLLSNQIAALEDVDHSLSQAESSLREAASWAIPNAYDSVEDAYKYKYNRLGATIGAAQTAVSRMLEDLRCEYDKDN